MHLSPGRIFAALVLTMLVAFFSWSADAPMGYSTYTFVLGSRVDTFDPNVVLGLFTWDDDAPTYNYREVDIEFGRWSNAAGPNAQFAVQPWTHPGNLHKFNAALQGDDSTHRFVWTPTSVGFSSVQDQAGDLIESWLYTGPDIPPAGVGSAHINLWLNGGVPPADGREVEVVVKSFQFVPSP